VQHQSAGGTFHPHGQLEQALAQPADLGGGEAGPLRPQPQLLKQDIGSGAEQDPELIGEKARATGAVNVQTVIQFLDAQFDEGPLTVDLLVELSLINAAPGRSRRAN
jgi:hypothetical protein